MNNKFAYIIFGILLNFNSIFWTFYLYYPPRYIENKSAEFTLYFSVVWCSAIFWLLIYLLFSFLSKKLLDVKQSAQLAIPICENEIKDFVKVQKFNGYKYLQIGNFLGILLGILLAIAVIQLVKSEFGYIGNGTFYHAHCVYQFFSGFSEFSIFQSFLIVKSYVFTFVIIRVISFVIYWIILGKKKHKNENYSIVE